jgi:predicted RNase H-like nuclease (RuvC/YqgF family)
MLLNEFFKEQRKVQKQQQKIDSLKAELREQRELIQKIGDRLEITKSAPQMVSNDRRYGLLE